MGLLPSTDSPGPDPGITCKRTNVVTRAILVFLVLMLSTASSLAATRYVTDQFQITMRTGMSTSHKIISMLPTGSALEVLSVDRESGYTQVRTADGKTGYVLTRQLLDEPVARDRLGVLQERVAELEAAPGELSARLASLQKEHAALEQDHTQLQKVKQQIETDYGALQRTAANAVRISNERNELRKLVAQLTGEVEELKQQKRELENSSAQRWFLIGAGVILGGVLLGLILPNLRIRRRRDSWGTL